MSGLSLCRRRVRQPPYPRTGPARRPRPDIAGVPGRPPPGGEAAFYSMSSRISPGSSPASRNSLRVTKFHTMTMAVTTIFEMR